MLAVTVEAPAEFVRVTDTEPSAVSAGASTFTCCGLTYCTKAAWLLICTLTPPRVVGIALLTRSEEARARAAVDRFEP